MKHIFTTLLFLAFSTLTLSAQETDQDLQGQITSIEFSEDEFEWGEVIQGEKIQNVFYFKNTGTEPLIIINAKGSCGCTIPRYPKEPIMPGERASLLVHFDSKNKKGKQSKRVTITANTSPANTYLTIKGKVLVPDSDVSENETIEDAFMRGLGHSIEETEINEGDVNIYPNPTSDLVQLKLEQHTGKKAFVEIFNNVGQRLASQKIDAITNEVISFDVSQYQNGNYTMSIKIEGANRIAKQFAVTR